MIFAFFLAIITIPQGNPEDIFVKQVISKQIPFTFDFISGNTLFVYSRDTNNVYRFHLDKKGLKLDTFLHFTGVKGKIYSGFESQKHVYLFSDKGIFYGKSVKFKKILNEKSVIYTDTVDGKLLALGERYLHIINNGKLIRSIKVPSSAYFAPVNKNTIILGGNGKLIYLNIKTRETKTLCSINKSYKYFFAEIEKQHKFFSLGFKPYFIDDNKFIFFVGPIYKNGTNRGRFCILDSAFNILREFELAVEPFKIQKYNGEIVISGVDLIVSFMNGEMEENKPSTRIYFLDPLNMAIKDSFVFSLTPIFFLNINKNYWLLGNEFGVIYFFRSHYEHKLINPMIFMQGMAYLANPIKVDPDADGDSDIIFLGTTNSSAKKENRNYYIVFFKNNISSMIEYADTLLALARMNNDIINAPKGIRYVEEAMDIFSFLRPESLKTARKLRSSLIFYNKVHNSLVILLKFLILAPFLLIILFLWIKIKRLQDIEKPLPGGVYLEKLFSYPLFHKYNLRVEPNLGQDLTPQFVQEIVADSEQLYQFLLLPEVTIAFKNSNHFWRKLYSSLKRELCLIRFLSKLYLSVFENSPHLASPHASREERNKEGGIVNPHIDKEKSFESSNKFRLYLARGFIRKLLQKVLSSRLKRIGNLRNQFLEGLKDVRNDVVVQSLLPAIEDVKRKYPDVNIETKIEASFSFKFYQDELREFRRIFHAILENAAESFHGFKPKNVPRIKVTAKDKVTELIIKIEDNGKGIPEDMIGKIFEPGVSQKKGVDRGFGLTDVKNFIERYGEIHVESRVGEGTTFIIKIFLN